MNPKVIVIDGKTYHSVEEMPADIREKYEQALQALGDANKNQIPDVFETMNIFGLENLPPEARARYDEAMGKLDANRNGIPDFAEGMMNTSNPTMNSSISVGKETRRRSAPLPASPTITPDTSSGWMLVLAGLLLVGICTAGAAGIWYFFLR